MAATTAAVDVVRSSVVALPEATLARDPLGGRVII
jgi:hypothetical protein